MGHVHEGMHFASKVKSSKVIGNLNLIGKFSLV